MVSPLGARTAILAHGYPEKHVVSLLARPRNWIATPHVKDLCRSHPLIGNAKVSANSAVWVQARTAIERYDGQLR